MDRQLIDVNDLKSQIRQMKSLNEFVSRSTVADAIQNKDVVYIYYNGDETINRGYRTIEPFVLGVSTAGNIVVRAWQQAGATDTGNAPQRPNDEIPGWRLFRLDGITSMNKTLRKFEGNRPKYNPQDKQMTQIIMAVQPAGQQLPQSGDTKQPDTYQGMTKDKNWFQNQFDKFKNSFFGKKQQPDQTGKSNAWLSQQKRDFENKNKPNQPNTQNNAGV
jgi:hypothetical protein